MFLWMSSSPPVLLFFFDWRHQAEDRRDGMCNSTDIFPQVSAESTNTDYRGGHLVYNQQPRRGCGWKLNHLLYYRPVSVAKRWPNRPVVTSVFSFSSFVCASPIPFFSAPKVRQLWEIGPSCQHFNVIKESVNQSTSSSKTEPPPQRLLFQPQSGPPLRD